MTNEERSKVREAFMQLDEVDILLPGKYKRVMMFQDSMMFMGWLHRTTIYPQVPGCVDLL